MTSVCAECHKPHVKSSPDFVTCLTCHQDPVENQAHLSKMPCSATCAATSPIGGMPVRGRQVDDAVFVPAEHQRRVT